MSIFDRSAKRPNPVRLRTLEEAAAAKGFEVRFEGTVYVRNWPQVSERPYHLRRNGKFLAAFKTIEAIEAKVAAL